MILWHFIFVFSSVAVFFAFRDHLRLIIDIQTIERYENKYSKIGNVILINKSQYQIQLSSSSSFIDTCCHFIHLKKNLHWLMTFYPIPSSKISTFSYWIQEWELCSNSNINKSVHICVIWWSRARYSNVEKKFKRFRCIFSLFFLLFDFVSFMCSIPISTFGLVLQLILIFIFCLLLRFSFHKFLLMLRIKINT